MLQEPMRPREYRQLPSRTPDPKTPVDNWAADDWLSQGVWGLEDASDDDGTMPPIGFRLSGRMRRLADQIRTDPNSPYFNLFKTPTDLWRHLVVKGLIALGEAYVLTRGMAQSMHLQEQVLATSMAMKSTREQMNKTVEMTIRAVAQEWDSGNSVEAAANLDQFFDGILEWDEGRRKTYVTALLTHPAFKKIREDYVMIECSRFLKDFKEKYLGGSLD